MEEEATFPKYLEQIGVTICRAVAGAEGVFEQGVQAVVVIVSLRVA